MQTIANGYRGVSLIVQLAADRVLVPIAIAASLMLAAAVLFQMLNVEPAVSPGFF